MAFDPTELSFIRVLRELTSEQILAFLDACQPVEVPADEVIVVEGEEDDAMVFILEGLLEVFVGQGGDAAVLQQLRRGESVGELALLGLAKKRTASVRTVEPSALLVLERAGLDRLRAAGHPVADRLEDSVLRTLADRIRETDRKIGLLAEGTELESDDAPEGLWARLASSLGAGDGPGGRAPKAAEVLKQSAHFGDLDSELARKLAAHMDAVGFRRGERILDEGSMKGDAWIVATGEVGVYRATRSHNHEKVGVLGPGALFGHLAIIDDHMRTATCVADTGSWLFRIPRDLTRAVVTSDQPEARALRRCFIHALAKQLQSANTRLADVTRAKAAKRAQRELDAAAIEAVNKAKMAVESAR